MFNASQPKDGVITDSIAKASRYRRQIFIIMKLRKENVSLNISNKNNIIG